MNFSILSIPISCSIYPIPTKMYTYAEHIVTILKILEDLTYKDAVVELHEC